MSRRNPPPRPVRRNVPKVARADAPSRRSPGRTGRASDRRSSDGRSSTGRSSDRRSSTGRSSSGRASSGRASSGRASGRRASDGRSPSGRSSTGRASAPARRSGTSARQRRQVTFSEPGSAPSRRHVRTAARPAKRRTVTAAPPRPPRHDRFGLGSSPLRLRLLLVVLLVVLGSVLFRVARLQSTGGETLRLAGQEQWNRTRSLPADRGTIFDRDGEELAVSVPAYAISVNPKLVEDEEGTARLLQSTLGLTEGETRELYDELVAKTKGFAYVRREVDIDTGTALAALRLPGVNVDPEDRRVLPGGDTGRSVIGRTDIDGIGIAGLELQYDALLTGTPGELRKEVAPGGRSIAGTEQVVAAPVPGQDLVLTIDRSIQFAAESVLVGRVTELGARSGTIIVMDTHTGDLYAMASVVRDDTDGVVEITSGNLAAVNAYEPGSVAKVITIAAGLNEGAVTPGSTFVVPWRRQYADDLLSDSHQHPDELMTVEQILVESSNIGTIDVQESLDPDWETARRIHWEYMRNFGLGEKTALDFPGESAGILKHWTDLWGSERVTVAYGQGVASTSVQLASAINVIANDGVYVAPRLIQATVGPTGEMTDAPPSDVREVIAPEVAEQMQDLMRQVVCRGTAKRAQEGITGFSVAGKTGTGLKPHPDGRYQDDLGQRLYYASFVGFFPAEDPQITVLVSIDEPPAGDINRFGGTAAAPVFADLAPTIVHERGIEPPPDSTPCAAS